MNQKDKPVKYWVTISMIEGYIAMWSVRQSPYHQPDYLLGVIKQFRDSVRPLFDANEMLQISRTDLRVLLNSHLLTQRQVQLWNERKNGNQNPIGFVSRYDRPDPDNDFIDLHALSRNIEMGVFRECEHDAISDHKITQDWRRGWLSRKLFRLKQRIFKTSTPSPESPSCTSACRPQ